MQYMCTKFNVKLLMNVNDLEDNAIDCIFISSKMKPTADN